MEVFSVKDKLPNVECGSYLVYAPQSFPKNSRWIVAEYKDDAEGFYSESGDSFLEDVTHWCELPPEPKSKVKCDCYCHKSNQPVMHVVACCDNGYITKKE